MILFFLTLAMVLLLANHFRKSGAYVILRTDKEKEAYSLNDNQEITIEDEDGSKNVISIQDGKVSMKAASCPDLICVHHKPIYKNGEVIICVPNHVSLEIVSDIENEIDN